jgi:hypothetical protein
MMPPNQSLSLVTLGRQIRCPAGSAGGFYLRRMESNSYLFSDLT